MKHILLILVTFLWLPFGLTAADKAFTVAIDAGHGGKDPGAVGKTAYEKNITLSVARKLGKQLEEAMPGQVRVVYTRRDDRFVELERRAAIANEQKADVFVSIHADAADNRAVTGFGTFTMGTSKEASNLAVSKRENSVMLLEDNYRERYAGFDPNSVESYIIFELMQDVYVENSIQLASTIQSVMVGKGRLDRSVRQAPFWVLHRTGMPSVLVELGFITNLEEEKYLCSEKGQNELAEGMCRAIQTYKEDCDRKSAAARRKNAPADNTASVPQTSDSREGVTFRVQVLTSKTPLAEKDARLTGLADVSRYEEGGIYKYTSGIFASEKEAIAHRNKINGSYPDAFIVAIRDGKRIPLSEARP